MTKEKIKINKKKLSAYFGDIGEFAVVLDLMKKGWEPFFHLNKRTLVDLMTFDPIQKRSITYQIKTLATPGGQKDHILPRKREWLHTYSGGIRYADYKVDYLVGVLPASPDSNKIAQKILYYPLEVYKHFGRLNTNTVASVEHPINPELTKVMNDCPSLEELFI